MRKYRIALKDGRVYQGTPKEIARKMRDTSYFDYDKPVIIYMLLVSHRHWKLTGKRLDCRSYKDFVLSLSKSVMAENFEEIEQPK